MELELHTDVVSPELLTLLQELMANTRLLDFRLVGGTALALLLGHRKSIDIDMFSCTPFDAVLLSDNLDLQGARVSENAVTGAIRGIKVDFISHRYQWLTPPIERQGIRFASLEDIAAMKLNAIANRGAKKDFWDIATLLACYSLEELLEFYRQRYPHMDDWQVIRSLIYFDDAENDPDPIVLNAMTWDQVKERIRTQDKL